MFRQCVVHWLRPIIVDRRASVGLLLLRWLVGAALSVHGYGKLMDVAAFAQEFSIPIPLAYLATITQLAAGASLSLGLLTPLSAGALASTMVVATSQLMARREPWIQPHGHSYEASLFYLVANIVLMLCGPGRFSFDGLLIQRLSQNPRS